MTSSQRERFVTVLVVVEHEAALSSVPRAFARAPGGRLD